MKCEANCIYNLPVGGCELCDEFEFGITVNKEGYCEQYCNNDDFEEDLEDNLDD